MSESSSNKENAKKIVISVVSTVLAAFLIFYFIESRKAPGQRKEATLRAWNSYNQNRSIFQKTMQEMGAALQAGQGDINTVKTHAFTEMDISVSNLENIKTQSNVDDRLFSLVDVMINNIKQVKILYGDFMDKLIQMVNSDITETAMQAEASNMVTDMSNKINEMKSREKIRVETLTEGLCKEYGGEICK